MDRKSIFALLLGLAVSASAYALKDPTQPTDPANYFGYPTNPSDSSWSLQSILSAPQRRIAVINGTRVREGDRIGAARVVRIHNSGVVLDSNGRRLTLDLFQQVIEVAP